MTAFGFNYNGVKRWTTTKKLRNTKHIQLAPNKEIDTIFDADKMIFPILNERCKGLHWTVVCIDFRYQRIEYYDSMAESHRSFAMTVTQYIKNYLIHEHRERKELLVGHKKYQELNIDEWSVHLTDKNVPQQGNVSDCGIFALKYCDWLADDEQADFGFSQQNMCYFRKRIKADILTGELECPIQVVSDSKKCFAQCLEKNAIKINYYTLDLSHLTNTNITGLDLTNTTLLCQNYVEQSVSIEFVIFLLSSVIDSDVACVRDEYIIILRKQDVTKRITKQMLSLPVAQVIFYNSSTFYHYMLVIYFFENVHHEATPLHVRNVHFRKYTSCNYTVI